MKKLILAVAALSALASSASAYTITANPLSDQELRYDHGEAMLVSRKDGSVVRALPHANGPHGRMLFTILAYNAGKTPFNLGYENIQVTDAKGPVRLFTLDDIQHEATKSANWRRAVVMMSAGAGILASSLPNTYSSSGSVSTSDGGYANFTSSGSSYNPALSSIAASQVAGDAAGGLQAISANLDAYMGTIASRILQITTIDPATASGGAVFADRPKFDKGEDRTVKVAVRVGSDEHDFSFTVTE
jgi:hypothetical protein